MAATVTSSPPKGRSGGNERGIAILRVTLDGAYASGGEPFEPKQYLGWTPAVVQLVERYASGATGSGGRIHQYDYTNKTIRVFEDGASVAGQLDEVGAIDLSTTVLDAICWSD